VLNTFLLAEGHQQLVLNIPECPNARTALPITVRNDSQLGSRTVSALAQHRGSRWIWQEGDIDSTHFPLGDPDLSPWFDRPDALHMTASIAARDGLDRAEAQSLRDFVEHGYCTLPYRVDDALLERLNQDLDRMLAQGEIAVADEGVGDHRVELIHEKSCAAAEIWVLPPVMKFLRSVFQEEVLPCQTLVFVLCTRLQILRMFLGEAVLLAALGGALGLAMVTILVISMNTFLPGLPVALQPVYMLGALVLSCGVGLAAGISPAMRAARLDPIEALRAE